MLKHNKNKLSDKYLDIIRYHSFYPWHTSGDYHEFMNDEDKKTLEDVIYFNQFDLYSKEDDTNISDEVKEYYNQIIDDFFINDLQW